MYINPVTKCKFASRRSPLEFRKLFYKIEEIKLLELRQHLTALADTWRTGCHLTGLRPYYEWYKVIGSNSVHVAK
jgi:hypothetical protein